MSIKLTSSLLEVEEIVKNTGAEMFCNLEVGDTIQLSVEVEGAGTRPSGSTYATYIKAENTETGEHTYKSFNQIPKFLECFKFIEKLT